MLAGDGQVWAYLTHIVPSFFFPLLTHSFSCIAFLLFLYAGTGFCFLYLYFQLYWETNANHFLAFFIFLRWGSTVHSYVAFQATFEIHQNSSFHSFFKDCISNFVWFPLPFQYILHNQCSAIKFSLYPYKFLGGVLVASQTTTFSFIPSSMTATIQAPPTVGGVSSTLNHRRTQPKVNRQKYYVIDFQSCH